MAKCRHGMVEAVCPMCKKKGMACGGAKKGMCGGGYKKGMASGGEAPADMTRTDMPNGMSKDELITVSEMEKIQPMEPREYEMKSYIKYKPKEGPGMKIIFKRGTKKPWKIVDSKGTELGSAMTKTKAEELSKSLEQYPKKPLPAGQEPGIDQFSDEAVANAPAPIKSAIAKVTGKGAGTYTPARGRMEGEAASVDIEDMTAPEELP